MASLGFAGATYMQDINKTFCDNTNIPIGTEGRLVDKRDSKVYWVAKLNDGLCWMTQNLDLDIPANGLTSELSDMASDWNSNNTSVTPPVVTTNTIVTWIGSNSNLVASYDPGNTIYVNGITPANANAELIYGEPSYPWTEEDAHYLIGNYYSFNAATAGSGKNKTSGNKDAIDSICPKGWKLPLSGSSNGLSASAASGSFGLMLNKQGITGDANGYNNITKPEYSMYFVRGGSVYNGSLNLAGDQGRYWSSTAYDASNACSLNFNGGGVAPSNYYNRYVGFSVRCVAR